MSGVVFGWDSLARVFAEPNWSDLIAEHWAELGVHRDQMILDPDYDLLLVLAKHNRFRAWTARCDGLLVGYMGWMTQPHLHYRRTLHAVEDLFLMSAPYRRGLNGYRMFTECFAALREIGAQRCIIHEKVHFQHERAEDKTRAIISREVKKAIEGDEKSIDNIVEYFFTGSRTSLGELFKRMGFVHTDNLWSMML